MLKSVGGNHLQVTVNQSTDVCCQRIGIVSSVLISDNRTWRRSALDRWSDQHCLRNLRVRQSHELMLKRCGVDFDRWFHKWLFTVLLGLRLSFKVSFSNVP